MRYFTLLAALILSFISGKANGETPDGINAVAREWVDLGLPSGTLWASKPEEGFYKWYDAMQLFGANTPSVWQWKELIDGCSFEDTDNGWIAIGKNGNSIFIPATGIANHNGKIAQQSKSCGFYWSSKKINDKKAYGVFFESAERISTIPHQATVSHEDSNTIRPAWIEYQLLRVWLVNK